MPAVHDRGGWPDDTPIDRTEHEYSDWGAACRCRAPGAGRPGHPHHRRDAPGHREPAARAVRNPVLLRKWTAALEILLIEKGILTAAEIDAKAAELRERGL